MQKVFETAIKSLASKAKNTNTSTDALKFSQAAVNLANALYAYDDNIRNAKIAGKVG